MIWNKVSVKDKNGFWTDYKSENGDLLIAKGYEELEKAKGNPWTLFKIVKEDKWVTLGYFPTVAEAQKSAESVYPTGG